MICINTLFSSQGQLQNRNLKYIEYLKKILHAITIYFAIISEFMPVTSSNKVLDWMNDTFIIFNVRRFILKTTVKRDLALKMIMCPHGKFDLNHLAKLHKVMCKCDALKLHRQWILFTESEKVYISCAETIIYRYSCLI